MRLQTQVKATSVPNPTFTPVRNGFLQRKCSCGGSTSMSGECAECRNKRLTLQRRSTNQDELSTVPPIVHEVLHSPSQPLEPETRTFMESRFGHDFSQVRVHTDARAAESARAVHAQAYTMGQDIVFGEGQYATGTEKGRKLLAHELTHVVQQSHRGTQVTQEKENQLMLIEMAEQQAEAISMDVGSLGSLPESSTQQTQLQLMTSIGIGPSLQRQSDKEEKERERKQTKEEETSVQVGESTPVIWFEFNSTKLRQDSEADSVVHFSMALERIQRHLAETGDIGRIILHGYASSEGDEVHNRNLSQQRADRIKELLVAAGVPEARITTTGHGPDGTFPGLKWNRRVEVELTPTVTRIEMEEERITVRTFSELSLTDSQGNILSDRELSRRLPQAVRVNVTSGTTPDMQREEQRLAEVVRVLRNYEGKFEYFAKGTYLRQAEENLAKLRLRLSERTTETGKGPSEFADAPQRMIFDGITLTIEQADGTVRTYVALSGTGDIRSDQDTSVQAQRQERRGPIPEGGYWIDPCERTGTRWTPGDWGNVRIVLHPYDTTVTYGRGGFFLHGGASPGSAGCIELQNGKEIEVIDQQLRSAELCQSGEKVNITVTYRKHNQ